MLELEQFLTKNKKEELILENSKENSKYKHLIYSHKDTTQIKNCMIGQPYE